MFYFFSFPTATGHSFKHLRRCLLQPLLMGYQKLTKLIRIWKLKWSSKRCNICLSNQLLALKLFFLHYFFCFSFSVILFWFLIFVLILLFLMIWMQWIGKDISKTDAVLIKVFFFFDNRTFSDNFWSTIFCSLVSFRFVSFRLFFSYSFEIKKILCELV